MRKTRTRRNLICLLSIVAASPQLTLGQQHSIRRIGFLGLTAANSTVTRARLDSLRTGLANLGYVEGKNTVFEYRWADGDYSRLPRLAKELVALRVDVLFTYGTAGASAAKQATKMIPIVAVFGDPETSGLVTSLAHPGGNLTGLAIFVSDETVKRLELVKDVLPHVRRIAVLGNPENVFWSKVTVPAIQQAGKKIGVEAQLVDARGRNDFERAFAAMHDRQAEALVIFEDPILASEARALAALALRHQLPSIGPIVLAEAGGLIGNGADLLDLYQRAAGLIDQIFKGAEPGNLPIQRASRFELVVNQTTATTLGISIPKHVIFRADKIIE